jgi:hypothetical protein
MARVKSAVAGEGIPTEEEAAYTMSTAAGKPRKTVSARAIWMARDTFRRMEANNLPTCIPLEADACLASFVKNVFDGYTTSGFSLIFLV